MLVVIHSFVSVMHRPLGLQRMSSVFVCLWPSLSHLFSAKLSLVFLSFASMWVGWLIGLVGKCFYLILHFEGRKRGVGT